MVMDSDSSYSSEYNTNQNNSGLLRFRSAPSSLSLDGVAEKSGKISDEISRFTSFGGGYGNNNNNYQFSHGGLQFLEDKDNNNEKATANNYASVSSQLLLPPQYPNPIPRPITSAITVSQMGSVNSGYGVNSQGGIVGSNSLMRQNSSPAGLFSQTGYAKIRGIPSYAFSNGSSSNGIRDLGCSSPGNRIPSSFGMLSRISEVENDEKIGTREESQFYCSNFPIHGNNGSSNYSGNFSVLKREMDSDQSLFSDNQGGEEPITQPLPVLSHHSSLPKTSAEISAMEKLMQFQDTVPCKIRAKRGCATHPRSIAERVRRTRISDRMRKLQELVPNMEKQTNTADMLDLAVGYIKDLQKQYKTLTDIQANCKCSSTQNSVSDQMF